MLIQPSDAKAWESVQANVHECCQPACCTYDWDLTVQACPAASLLTIGHSAGVLDGSLSPGVTSGSAAGAIEVLHALRAILDQAEPATAVPYPLAVRPQDVMLEGSAAV